MASGEMEIQQFLTPQQIDMDGKDELNRLKAAADAQMAALTWNVNLLTETSNSFSMKCIELNTMKQETDNQCSGLSNGVMGGQSSYSPENVSRSTLLEGEALQLAEQILSTKASIVQQAVEVINKCNALRGIFNHMLRSAQQIAKWTNVLQICLETSDFQKEAEYLMEVAWALKDNLKRAEITNSVCCHGDFTDVRQLIQMTVKFIQELAHDSFVVVTQPCQVVKTKSKFHSLPGRNAVEISLLVGTKLGLHLCPATVSAYVLDEQKCRQIHAGGYGTECFDGIFQVEWLSPDHTKLDYVQERECWTAVFPQLGLGDKFNRDDEGGRQRKDSEGENSELVHEKKWALVFRLEFQAGDIDFKIWTMSVPMTVTSHWSQERLACAVVTWDNARSPVCRVPFQIPPYVTSDDVIGMLNNRFSIMVGCPLRQENVEYFHERLSTHPGYPHQMTYIDLCKKHLPNKDFSFWDWFYEGTKVIEQYFKHAFIHGFVKGFIGKQASENLLYGLGYKPGTFLLRFSESTLDGLSIVFLHADGKAYNLSPFKCKQFTSTSKSLVEQLNLKNLVCVYPSTKKEVAFQRHYKEYESAMKVNNTNSGDSSGYVGIKTQVVIDGLSDQNAPQEMSPLPDQMQQNGFSPGPSYSGILAAGDIMMSPPIRPMESSALDTILNAWPTRGYDSTETVQSNLFTNRNESYL